MPQITSQTIFFEGAKKLHFSYVIIFRMWSLFCSIRVNLTLHFLPILLEIFLFNVLRFFYFLPVLCQI